MADLFGPGFDSLQLNIIKKNTPDFRGVFSVYIFLLYFIKISARYAIDSGNPENVRAIG